MDEYNPRAEKHNKKFSKRIVILSILSVLIYTAIVLYFSWYEHTVPDSLTYSFYGVFGIELGALAGIKIKESKGGYQ